MTYAWEDLEGVSLAGEYGLDQWLGSEPSGAFFLTSFGPERRRAVLQLVVEDPSTAEAQLALWHRASGLAHTSLMALLDCGRTAHGGGSFLFAVFEAPDDSLAAAVENGPLSEDEARDILEAALGALGYLHSRGWAHTSIDTGHVVALQDRIKLASDTLWDGPHIQTSQSDDVRALGALLYELLTGRRTGTGESADVSGISDPLRTIIQHALEPDVHYRWTAAQMAEALNRGLAGDAAAAIEPVDRTPANEPCLPVEEPQTAEVRGVAEPLPARQEVASPDLERRESVPRPASAGPSARATRDKPFAMIGNEEAPGEAGPSVIVRSLPLAGAAAVALLAIVFVVAHHAAPAPPATAIAPPATAIAPPPATPAPHVAEPVARVIPAGAPKQPLHSWRVIAYTYARRQDAEKKAQSVNTRFADIHAEVFAVGSSYLISLGAHMTRDEAAALQRLAIGKGLPHDTYIQNFRIEE